MRLKHANARMWSMGMYGQMCVCTYLNVCEWKCKGGTEGYVAKVSIYAY